MKAVLACSVVVAPAGVAVWLLWPWIAAAVFMILGLMLGDAVFK